MDAAQAHTRPSAFRGMSVSTTFNTRELRDAFGSFATGVTVITARRPDGEPVGVTANSFTSVSLTPPLALWCIARDSASAVAFADGAVFAVHVLGAAQRDLALRFASRGSEKFPAGASLATHGHAPLVPAALCRIDCTVEQTVPGGDHLIVIGRVTAIDKRPGSPLLFHGGRFGQLETDATSPAFDIWDSLSTEWF